MRVELAVRNKEIYTDFRLEILSDHLDDLTITRRIILK
jgi:hypothetical protein